ncbi:MAG: hypothetical protein ACSLFP_06930 [Acidimicrobiales bacterium]
MADPLRSVRVYDRSTFERRLADIEEERDRLLASIATAEARRAELQQPEVPTPTEQVGAVMLEAQATLTTEWDDCRRDEAALEEATDAVVSWILAAAQTRAEALRAVAARIRAGEAGTGPDLAEAWWQGVIDLTKADAPESARSS